jgi:beta-galactosidase
VIMWSIGNEIPDMDKPETVEIGKRLAAQVRLLDPTRPVTAALDKIRDDKDPAFGILDVCGYNYAEQKYAEDHERVPDRIMYGSESYAMAIYDSWMAAVDSPWVIGDFVWTGFDYLGEASIGWKGYPHDKSFFPWSHAYCGDIDICGWRRPQSFYRGVVWNTQDGPCIFVKPPVPSFPGNPDKEPWSNWEWHDVSADWTWPGHESVSMEVEVYCAHESVELLLNGKTLGKRDTNRHNRWTAVWSVPYQAGELHAVARNGDQIAGDSVLSTAHEVSRLRVAADRTVLSADGWDLSYVTIELVDSAGFRNPKADNLLRFRIDGPGTIVAIGSSNPVSTESYQKSERRAYQGRCLVVVRSGRQEGAITLEAAAEGLESATIELTCVG